MILGPRIEKVFSILLLICIMYLIFYELREVNENYINIILLSIVLVGILNDDTMLFAVTYKNLCLILPVALFYSFLTLSDIYI